MRSSVSSGPRVNVLGKSILLSLTSLSPLASSLLTLIAFKIVYGENAVLAVGMSGNILGIIVALSAGCMVMSLRSFAKMRGSNSQGEFDFVSTLRREHSNAYMISAIIFLLVAAITIGFLASKSSFSEPFVYYLAGSLLWLCLLPFSQVSAGFLQAFDQDRKIFTANLAMVALHLCMIIFVVVIKPSTNSALLLVSLLQSLSTLGVYLYRLRLVRELVGVSIRKSFVPTRGLPSWSNITDRILAGSDGLIFMGFFFLATLVAASHSAEDGAVIATVVSFMRMLVIPLKQFGMVGGRFILRAPGSSLNPQSIQRAALIPCLVAAAVAFACAYVWLPVNLRLPLGLLVAAQIILEPYSGVTYSMGKVIYGPRALIGILGICYLALGAPALALLGVTGLASALAVWVSIFLTRLIFTVSVQWRLHAVRSRQNVPIST